ncbi:MAG TPA: hypothetical protein EYQ08_11315 [Planctomycetes bacterium]|nr:hypothetical protein [Planctomycetota bacterium]
MERDTAMASGPDPELSLLDELVFECLEEVEDEGFEVIERLCGQHPDLATALRARLSALRNAGFLPEGFEGAELPESVEEAPPGSLVDEWLGACERDDAEARDTLCAAFPEHAAALRSLHPRERPDSRPIGVDLGTGDDSAWEVLIDQLRSRGPTYERYVFEDEVARGGMGVIYRVFDKDARRRLALKVMLDDSVAQGPDDASLGRFLEEAQVTSQLDHPGIVPVHEIGVDGEGRTYFTMKLVKGEDLRAIFARVADPDDEDWTQTRALNVLLRVCEAAISDDGVGLDAVDADQVIAHAVSVATALAAAVTLVAGAWSFYSYLLYISKAYASCRRPHVVFSSSSNENQ